MLVGWKLIHITSAVATSADVDIKENLMEVCCIDVTLLSLAEAKMHFFSSNFRINSRVALIN